MPWYTKHGEEFELPDVTTRPVNEALQLLKRKGFHPVLKDSVYDAHFPSESVIRQNPLPFSMVKKGRRVYLVISIGQKPLYVPNLIGKTPQDAEFLLKEKSLQLNTTFYEFSEFYPRGVVINQSVPPETEVPADQKINITVSLGPPPSAQEVPQLVGKSFTTAKKILEAVGISLNKVRLKYEPKLVPGTVLGQSVKPGTPAKDVKAIDLVVSTDKKTGDTDEAPDAGL